MTQLTGISPLRATAALLLIFCLFLASACGKEGLPQPQDDSRTFSWEEVSAKPTGKCLTFTGTLKGAFNNFNGIRLEVDGVSGPEDCPGCPFVPSEILTFTPAQSGFAPNTGGIVLAYCPRPALSYRWRLIGMNVYNSLPHAVSPVHHTIMVD